MQSAPVESILRPCRPQVPSWDTAVTVLWLWWALQAQRHAREESAVVLQRNPWDCCHINLRRPYWAGQVFVVGAYPGLCPLDANSPPSPQVEQSEIS